MSKYIYLIIILLLFSISFVPGAEAAFQSGAKTSVKANIPSRVDIRIYGYTAPYSIVQATSIRVFAQVTSDKTGYFIIDPLPISSDAREICLTTIDSQKRYGFPLCVSLPENDKPAEIGPLLLSPTISLSGGSPVQSREAQSAAGGTTLPNADMEISFFENNSGAVSFVPQAFAKTIAKIPVKTDNSGSYSINLPVNKPVSFRLFAKAFFIPPGEAGGLPTPKSQTLTYSVASYTDWWIRNILPKLILFLFFLILLVFLIVLEIKTKKGRLWWRHFNETKLQPARVRSGLALRRIDYNFRDFLRSHQK